MSINPLHLKGKSETESVILYVKHFNIGDRAPVELKTMYKPKDNTLYKALHDTNSGVYYLDIPEAQERDSSSWAISQLKSKDEEADILDYEASVVTKDNALDFELSPDELEKLAKWLEEDPMLFSWETEAGENVAPPPQEVPETSDEWKKQLLEQHLEETVLKALRVIQKENEDMYSSLSILIVSLSLQEQGIVPRVTNVEKLLTHHRNTYGIPLSIAAILDSHVSRQNVPNMISVIKLALTEINRLMDSDVTEKIKSLLRK